MLEKVIGIVCFFYWVGAQCESCYANRKYQSAFLYDLINRLRKLYYISRMWEEICTEEDNSVSLRMNTIERVFGGYDARLLVIM